MPSPVLKRLKEILKVSFVEPSEYSSRLFNLEPGLVYRKDPTPFNTTLKFTINYNQTVIVPFFEMERSLRGLDPDGEVIVDEDYNELQIFGSPAQGDAAVLGKVFLSQVQHIRSCPIASYADYCSYTSTSTTRGCRSTWRLRRRRRQPHSQKRPAANRRPVLHRRRRVSLPSVQFLAPCYLYCCYELSTNGEGTAPQCHSMMQNRLTTGKVTNKLPRTIDRPPVGGQSKGLQWLT